MKKGLTFLAVAILLLSSCGGSNLKIDENLSEEEATAVTFVDAHLERGCEIDSYEVITGVLPLALEDSKFKSYRDALNKARLDYDACIKRGLKDAAEKNLVTIGQIQDAVSKMAKETNSTEKYIIVLAKVKDKKRDEDKLTGIIAVFEPSTIKPIEWREITTPIVNTAVMICEAEKGTLAESTGFYNPDFAKLASSTSDPVMKFIFTVDAK